MLKRLGVLLLVPLAIIAGNALLGVMIIHLLDKSVIVHLSEVRNDEEAKVANELRGRVETAIQLVAAMAENASDGQATKEAQEKALAVLGKMRFDGGNYFWVKLADPSNINYGMMLYHPDKRIIGRDITGLIDLERLNFIYHEGKVFAKDAPEVADIKPIDLGREANRICFERGEGVFPYYWPKDQDAEKDRVGYKKLCFVKWYPKWRWEIGCGSYADYVDSLVTEKKAKLHGDNNQFIESAIIIMASVSLALIALVAYLMSHYAKRQMLELQQTNSRLDANVKERTAMLLQSEKMASIGQLAAGVAHEINNPAGFVNGNLDTLKRYVGGLMELCDAQDEALKLAAEASPGGEEAAASAIGGKIAEVAAIKKRINLKFIKDDVTDLLNESVEGMERIGRIVSDLKDFSHVDKDDAITDNDLNNLADKAVNVAWNELKYKCEVLKEYGHLPLVPCNGGQICQVVLNLLVNASQAIEKRGKLTITTRVEGAEALLTVADDGPGIPEANQTKVFDPFFTTKPVGKGTGLGLHICQRILRSHGGSISLKSEPGKGAAFTIALPLVRKAASTRILLDD